ncbi:hypothetical protein NQ318_020838 [Aromia moschata]|uniref:HTH CENPB-type domain-containing protein n=1 Tax=Aromia moschata TaxID=1265417 RepID=A0AAV8Y9M3_9CUCU|nr:hypothetical protein NQ318_020838 [Aromia moschata]
MEKSYGVVRDRQREYIEGEKVATIEARKDPAQWEVSLEEAKALQAKQFHASLNVDSNFSASNGWLARFKKRHGIRCLNIKGEKLSANEDDANAFREGLKAFLENHGYKLDYIYNGDETSLFWKHLPTKTFVCRNKLKHQVENLPKIVLPYKFVQIHRAHIKFH